MPSAIRLNTSENANTLQKLGRHLPLAECHCGDHMSDPVKTFTWHPFK